MLAAGVPGAPRDRSLFRTRRLFRFRFRGRAAAGDVVVVVLVIPFPVLLRVVAVIGRPVNVLVRLRVVAARTPLPADAVDDHADPLHPEGGQDLAGPDGLRPALLGQADGQDEAVHARGDHARV